jgi:competence ComEA-like helix-hairpin-helix protein
VILRINFAEPQLQEREQPLPKRVQEDRKWRFQQEVNNAAELHKHGIAFAFSTQGQPGDRPWDKFRENLRKAIAAGLPPEAASRALTTDAARILGVEKQLGTIAAGKAAHLVVTDGDLQDAQTQVCHVFADGVHFEYAKPRPADRKPAPPAPGTEKKPEPPKPGKPAPGEPATEIEVDRQSRLHTGGNVLIRGATVLTVTQGTHPKTDILIRNGKIAQLGPGLAAPEGVAVLDATGLFVMPGIIDTHCHFAIAGGVNEFSLSVVPEVRVRDVIDSEDVEIFRALAGGVTTARLLHGSANVIGGQDAVIKLKYGRPARELLIADAPRGVKFALGENVKRTDGRFPNTRLGVEAVLIRAFTEARAYRQAWNEYVKSKSSGGPLDINRATLEDLQQLPGIGPKLAQRILDERAKAPFQSVDDLRRVPGMGPRALERLRPLIGVGRFLPEPRRDLRLEALADVLKGDLKVHCHCYRADEILMLLRVADHFGFKVKSLQHVLEGYKIAPEIADHGASCSTFSDWWAYKIEAYDAIPFNTALLHEAGAVVCLKSDSNELTRHLYQEAAKCIKYGGLSETEALKAITLNGARQLGLDKRLGSIEVGKDADLAIFNGHPLNSYARVEMTLVEGEVYFQRADKTEPAVTAAAAPAKPVDHFKPIPRSTTGNYVLDEVTVHPVTGPVIQKGRVYVQKGKITAVFDLQDGQVHTSPELLGEVRINAHGLHLYPGMIDAATVLGLTELGSARETHDYAEGGDFQPDLRASIGINPDSELIPVTRANGVTTVVTRPTGSLVAGQGALINLAGWVPREMAVVDPLALHVEFPGLTPMFTGDPTMPMVGRAIARKQRDEKVRRLKELFQQALVYDQARRNDAHGPVNPRLEALVPYARGQKPVIIQAYQKQEILEALKLADELKIKVILSGAIDAWKVAGELKKRDVAVIVGPIMTMPQDSFDPYDAPYACPARLHEAGVRFSIRSAGTSNTRNLPYEAAMAVSYGLPPEEGLRAVTLYPAQILGVADQLGSLAAGKRANLVLANGALLQASTQVLAVFIDGRPLEPVSKQTRLYERYRERLQEVKEGRAPLGTK